MEVGATTVAHVAGKDVVPGIAEELVGPELAIHDVVATLAFHAVGRSRANQPVAAGVALDARQAS